MLRLLPIPSMLALTLALIFNNPKAVAVAHEWYPQHCCSDKDCHPVACEEISASPDYYKWHGLLFPKNASFPSLDGACHVCVSKGDAPRCLFFGGVS